jgi:hypothetical protein
MSWVVIKNLQFKKKIELGIETHKTRRNKNIELGT